MDAHQNRIKSLTYDYPDHIPVSVSILPAAWMRHREALDEVVARHFLAEFMNTVTMSAIIVTLFFGGPNGPILVDGIDIHGPDVHLEGLRKKVGMVFQKSNPFPMSIHANVTFGPRMAGPVSRDRAAEIVERDRRDEQRAVAPLKPA